MCKTSTCKSTSTFKKVGVCTNAALSVATPPQTCTKDLDCVGSDGVNFYASTCNCGYNPSGTAYCSPFMGDSVAVAYITQWVKTLGLAQGVCHSVRRFSGPCLNMTGQTIATNQASYLYHLYAGVQANDNCVKYSFTYDYWHANAVILATSLLSLLI